MRTRTAAAVLILSLALAPVASADTIGWITGVFSNPTGPAGMVSDLSVQGNFGWGYVPAGSDPSVVQARLAFWDAPGVDQNSASYPI